MNSSEVSNAAGTSEGNAVSIRARSSSILAFVRLMRLAWCTGVCYVRYTLLRFRARDRHARRAASILWSRRWFQGGLRALEISVDARGTAPEGPAMLTPNHLSYLDIFALGSEVDTFFVAKAEVESWPIMGHLFKWAQQIAVSRGEKRGVQAANEAVVERLADGFSVCVFLEGTSSGGGDVMPFHASLLQPAVDCGVPVVPVAIRWRAADPAVDVAEDIAYWKDHTLVPHLWRLLGLRGVSAEISFGAPVDSAGKDRKELASEARTRVVALLESSGREN